MPIEDLHHVQLAMPPGREAEARAFYGGLLGLEEIPKPELLRASGGVWFRLGSRELHLGIEPGFTPARKAHPGMSASDLTDLAHRLEAAGHPCTWDDRIPDVPRFACADPFGNKLEFLAP
ncbi:MAG: glyoxalase [Planctomycetota bacterium]